MTTRVRIQFGATARATARHLLAGEGGSICGQLTASDLDREGAMLLEDDGAAWTVRGHLHHEGGRIAKLPVCSRCRLYAAALHAAASD